MRQNATVEDWTTPVLDSRAALALAALSGGSSVTDAARAAGVDRSTVYRWIDRSPEFVAELNRYRQEQRDALRHELRGLAADAIKAMRDLLGSDTPPAIRLRAALAVLEAVGADSPEPIGPLHPEDVGEQWSSRDLLRAIGGVG
jgi:hypothetical protein